jgi:hypothetical protein
MESVPGYRFRNERISAGSVSAFRFGIFGVSLLFIAMKCLLLPGVLQTYPV